VYGAAPWSTPKTIGKAFVGALTMLPQRCGALPSSSENWQQLKTPTALWWGLLASATQSGSKQLQTVTASLSIPSFATVVALSCRALQDKLFIDARHLSYVVGIFVSVKTAALHILTYLQSCIVFNCAGVIAHQPRQDTQASV
jgi:hypothetical protein